MAAAAAVMADQNLDSRVARLESDVAHIRSDIAEMRLDVRSLHAEIGDLRAEIGGVRGELHAVDTSLRAAIAELDLKLTRGLAANRIWMLLQSAGILAVMARAFKWI